MCVCVCVCSQLRILDYLLDDVGERNDKKNNRINDMKFIY